MALLSAPTPRLSADPFSKYSPPDRRAVSIENYFPPATSLWNFGFWRSGSKLGSSLSHARERNQGTFSDAPSDRRLLYGLRSSFRFLNGRGSAYTVGERPIDHFGRSASQFVTSATRASPASPAALTRKRFPSGATS